jgi:hypothetical protein
MAAAQAPTVTTSQLKGEVEYVEGNTLVVKLDNGEARTFNVPEARRFIVDGKELTVHQLVPGTKLTATVKTTATPVTIRTVTVKSGTVLHVMGNNVIVTLPSGENKQFIVKDDTKFTINGQPATVRDLRKGTVVSALRIVEEPSTELTMDVQVVGQAPAPAAVPAAEVAAAPAEAPRSEPAPPAAQASPAEPPPAAVKQAPAPVEAAPAAPKSSSRVPLSVGVLLIAGILVIWVLRRSKS